MTQSSGLFPELEKNKRYFFLLLWILSSLGFVYRGLVALRFWLYREKFLKTAQLSVPVLSIGNLTVGGTGKTPILIYLTRLFTTHSKRVGIVSRNYKANSKEILKVELNNKSGVSEGRKYGDEPLLVFQKTQVPVYVGPKKVETAKEIIRNEKIDLVIVDDGLQHLPLKKNGSIILLDVTQMDQNNFLFPRGRYREPFSGYKKADIIFWTKTNFISETELAKLRSLVTFSGLQVDWRFDVSEIEFPGFPNLNIDYRLNLSLLGKLDFQSIKRFVLVSAIARPEYFKKVVQDLNPKNEIVEKIFADHHQYSKDDLKTIMDKPLNFHHFLTTEKDYTKLKDLWPKEVPLGIVKWEPRPNIEDQQLYESIVSFLH